MTYLPRPRPCSITGCTDVVHAREMCPLHFSRWKNHGSPTAPALKWKPSKRRGETANRGPAYASML